MDKEIRNFCIVALTIFASSFFLCKKLLVLFNNTFGYNFDYGFITWFVGLIVIVIGATLIIGLFTEIIQVAGIICLCIVAAVVMPIRLVMEYFEDRNEASQLKRPLRPPIDHDLHKK